MFNNIYKFLISDKFYLPVIYISIGMIVYYVISCTIIKVNRINDKVGNKIISEGHNKRKNTVIGLINNIIKYIIAVIVIISILDVYKVNTDKIIASLGIASVVIGLAFQDIIKDFLAGIFIVFDNAYAVGDWVTVDGFKGEVISMGLKTTKIRAYTGEIMILANSNLTKVINYNLNSPKIYLKVPFSYEEKIEKIEEVLSKVLEEMKKEKEVKNSKLLGIDSFEENCIEYAIEVECIPNHHIPMKRLLLKRIKLAFDKNKIIIPYNQIDVHIDK